MTVSFNTGGCPSCWDGAMSMRKTIDRDAAEADWRGFLTVAALRIARANGRLPS
jgi:hypothetical protein